jgi:uncharacterized protein with HEPN domain
MSKREAGVLIGDIRAALEKIDRYIAGFDRQAFLADDKTSDAVVRNLEIIGEAVKKLPAELKELHPAIPWRQIAGLRDRVVHDYAGVDLELIWNILQTALAEFSRQLRALE